MIDLMEAEEIFIPIAPKRKPDVLRCHFVREARSRKGWIVVMLESGAEIPFPLSAVYKHREGALEKAEELANYRG